MPPKSKKNAKGQSNPKGMATPLPPGQVMVDLLKKEWCLGNHIGQGGFGYLYLGSSLSDGCKGEKDNFVVKVEPFMNGPLFVEIAFYHRVAKQEKIQNWLKSKKWRYVGVPKYVASGSFENHGTKYRFMVMERFGSDVEKLFQIHKKFSMETTFTLALRILDALEYIHANEYVHADIKASNLLLGLGKQKKHQVYLLDYGLAYRYSPNGTHTVYKEDPRRKHDGTTIYTSTDAHKGVAPSRRGDLEILGYCMLQWINGKLPWESRGELDKDGVYKDKQTFLDGLPKSVAGIIGQSSVELEDYFKHVKTLEYTALPDYASLKQLFTNGLKKLGVRDDGETVQFDVNISAEAKKDTKRTPRVKTPRNTVDKSPRKNPDPRMVSTERPPKEQKRKRGASPKAGTGTRKKAASPAKKATPSAKQPPRPRSPDVVDEMIMTDDEVSDHDMPTSPGRRNGTTAVRDRLNEQTQPARRSPRNHLPPKYVVIRLPPKKPPREPVKRPARHGVAMVDFAQSP